MLQVKQPAMAAAHAGGFSSSLPLCLKFVNKVDSGIVHTLILCKAINLLTLVPLTGLCFIT